MPDNNQYKSTIAEIIEAVGNLLNETKRPGFLVAMVLLVSFLMSLGFFEYRYLKHLDNIDRSGYENNKLMVIQNTKLDGIYKALKDTYEQGQK